MEYLLFVIIAILSVYLFIFFRKKNEMNGNIDLEKIAKEIICRHGLSSNTVRGFSCYIPDREPFPTTEGLLLRIF